MMEEGARVKLRPESRLGRQHPEMLGAVGVVGSIVRGSTWKALGSPSGDRARDVSMHVRFQELNLVALNVPAGDVEAVDYLDPAIGSPSKKMDNDRVQTVNTELGHSHAD